MYRKSSQNSAMKRKSIQIPIEIYEKDMCTELSREKRKEILNLFTNFNNLGSIEEFNEIEEDLHYLCGEGDIELIKIYLSETIENDTKNLEFKIDKTNQTASLFKVIEHFDQLIVPRAIKHDSTEYIITSISGRCNIKSLKFAEDSEVKTIYGNVFSFADIEELYFPSSLRELKEGWCCYSNKLTKIIISPSNGQFKYIDNKYLLGKSDTNSDEFDILLFASRDIKAISIPSNIKTISSFAFSWCENLTEVKIPSNSNLQTIGSHAFSNSKIEEIFIPPKVSIICENAFYLCRNLTKVVIPTNSNLQTIESGAFSHTDIEELYFPSSLKELKEGWGCYLNKLTKIIISPSNGQFKYIDNKYLLGKSDTNSDEFDILLFASYDIEAISIPPNIKTISSSAFFCCENLTEVEIPPNSNLQTIESHAFSNSKIEEIFIPPKVSIICENAFRECENLTKVVIPTDSNLQTIESGAFYFTDIEELYFPSSLRELKDGWCLGARLLTKITISPSNGQFEFIDDGYLLGKSDTNNDEFDTLLFVSRGIKEISIPSNIKIISSNSFRDCKKLTKVEIPINSNLQTIESNAFSNSNIKEISIPSKVSTICECTFYFCENLVNVEIPTNSNLQKIESNAFQFSKIKDFFIPSKVDKICEYAFSYCQFLQIIEISEESELDSFPLSAFSGCSNFIIMIPSSLDFAKA